MPSQRKFAPGQTISREQFIQAYGQKLYDSYAGHSLKDVSSSALGMPKKPVQQQPGAMESFATGVAEQELSDVQGLGKLAAKGASWLMNKVGLGAIAPTSEDIDKSGISPKTLEKHGFAEQAGGATAFIGEMVAQPDIALEKIGLTGVTHLAEKGLLNPENFNAIRQVVTSKWGVKAAEFLQDFAFGGGSKAVENASQNKPVGEGVISSGVETGIGGQILRPVIKGLTRKLGETGEAISGFLGKRKSAELTPMERGQQIQDIINPSEKYTSKEVEGMKGKTQVKRTLFGKKDVPVMTPSKETDVLGEMIDTGKVKSSMTAGEKVTSFQREARINDNAIDETLNRPEFNKPYTKATANKVFDDVALKAKSKKIFVAGSSEEKAYQDVIDIGKEEIEKNPMNGVGGRKAIKSFNARMEEVFGNKIYSADSEVAQSRVQAAKDVRKAWNDFIFENATSPEMKGLRDPKGKFIEPQRQKATDFLKDQLQREAILLNAADDTWHYERANLNNPTLMRSMRKFGKQHPILKKVVGVAAGVAGAGGIYEGGKELGL